jgi:hypothetical protein
VVFTGVARKLTRQDDGSFQGKTNATIQVDIRSEQPASMVRIVYGGEQDGAAPFEFQIRSGVNKLLVVALGVSEGQKMELVEADGASDWHLRNLFWSKTNFHTTLDIEGV